MRRGLRADGVRLGYCQRAPTVDLTISVNGPVAHLRRLERDTTPSTPSSRGKKARAPDSTGRFTRRSSKEYKADVAKGCKEFEELQALLEEYNAYRTVWKSNLAALLIEAAPARWRGGVAPLCVCE